MIKKINQQNKGEAEQSYLVGKSFQVNLGITGVALNGVVGALKVATGVIEGARDNIAYARSMLGGMTNNNMVGVTDGVKGNEELQKLPLSAK